MRLAFGLAATLALCLALGAVGDLTTSTIKMTTPTGGIASAFTYSFASTTAIGVGDTIVLKVPFFKIGAGAVAEGNTCGTSTFGTAAVANSGTANAAVTITVANAILAANVACSLTMATGISSPPGPRAANSPANTAALTSSSTCGQPATIIPVSPAIVATALTASVLKFATTAAAQACATYTYGFVANVQLAQGTIVTLTLPGFSSAAAGAIAAPTKSGCGTATWTGAISTQGTFDAQGAGTGLVTEGNAMVAKFTSATAVVPAAVGCSIIVGSAISLPSIVKTLQIANMADRTVIISPGGAAISNGLGTSAQGIAGSSNGAVGVSIANSPAITSSSISAITLTSTFAGTATIVTFGFKTAAGATTVAVGAKITVGLPKFLAGSPSQLAGTATGCPTSVALAAGSVVSTDSGLVNFKTVFTTSGASIAANTACSLSSAAGLTTPGVGLAANSPLVTAILWNEAGGSTPPVAEWTTFTNPASLIAPVYTLTFGTSVACSSSTVVFAFTTTATDVIPIGATLKLKIPYGVAADGLTDWTQTHSAAGSSSFIEGTAAGCATATATCKVTFEVKGAILAAAASVSLTLAAGTLSTPCGYAANSVVGDLSLSSIATTVLDASSQTATPLTVTKGVLTLEKTLPGLAMTSITYGFVASFPIAIAGKLVLKLPSFVIVQATATAKIGTTCGTTTYTAGSTIANSGQANAAYTIVTATAALSTSTACSIKLTAAVTPPAVATVTYGATSPLFTLAITESVAAVATATPAVISSMSNSIVGGLNAAVTVATPMTGTATAVTFGFLYPVAAGAVIAQGAFVTFVVPSFQFTNGELTVSATQVTTGTSTFTADGTGTNTATAAVKFTVATADISATTGVTVSLTIATGMTAPAAARAVNEQLTTKLVTIAVSAPVISTANGGTVTSTAIDQPAFTASVLTVATPILGAATAVTYGFACSAILRQADTITVALPSFAFGTLATPTKSGCGTTTWTVGAGGTSSGAAGAAMVFTAATADLAKDAACSIIMATGASAATSDAASTDANCYIAKTLMTANNGPFTGTNAYSVTGTLASKNNVAAAQSGIYMAGAVPVSPALVYPRLTASSLTWGATTVNTASALTFSFTSSGGLAQTATITLKVPSMSGITTALTVAPATVTALLTNSATANAKITFTVTSAIVAGTASAFSIATGVSTPVQVVAANSNTFTLALAANTNAQAVPAVAVATSPATVAPAILTSTLVLGDLSPCAAVSTLTYGFSIGAAMAIASTVTLVLPSFTGATAPTAALTIGGTAQTTPTTFTAAVAQGGDADANIVFTSAAAVIAATTACSLTVATGLSTPKAAVAASTTVATTYSAKFTVGAHPALTTGIGATTAITTSPAIYASTLSASVLTVGSALGSAVAALTYSFTATVPLAVDDTVVVKLPSFTGASVPTAAPTNCGTTTFTVAYGGSAANAALTFKAATATLAATTACTLTIATGLTNPATAAGAATSATTPYVIDASTAYTVAITVAACYDYPAAAWYAAAPATSLGGATAITALGFTTQSVAFSVSTMNTAAAVTYAFVLNQAVAAADTIMLKMPQFQGTNGALTAAATFSATATTTFTAALAGTASANAAVTFTAATATLAASVGCSLAIATGLSTPKQHATANSWFYGSATIAAGTAVGSSPGQLVPSSPSVQGTTLTASVISMSNTYAGAKTSFTYGFSANVAIAVADTIVVVLPAFTGTNGAIILQTAAGCGTTTFTTALAGQGTANAAVTFTTATATLAANIACSLKTECIQPPATTLAANAPTITVALTSAAMANLAATAQTSLCPTGTSPAIAVGGLTTSVLTLSSTISGFATDVTYAFVALAPVIVGATITLKLPAFTGAESVQDAISANDANAVTGFATTATAPTATATGCTSTFEAAFTRSGEAGAALIFTVGGSAIAASTGCSLTVASALTAATLTANTGVTVEFPAGTLAVPSSPAVSASKFTALSLILGTATTGYALPATAVATTFAFAYRYAITQTGTITLKLPSFTFSSCTAAQTCGSEVSLTATKTGGGTTTFTAVGDESGGEFALIVFTAATATLAASTATSLVIASGLTTAAFFTNFLAGASVGATYTLAVSASPTAASAAVFSSHLSTASATALTGLSGTALTYSATYAGAASSLSIAFTSAAVGVMAAQSVTIAVPNLKGATTPATTRTYGSCGASVGFIGTLSNSATANAVIAFADIAGSYVAAATACTLNVATGLTTPSVAETATTSGTSGSRTIMTDIYTNAVPIITTPATTLPALTASVVTLTTGILAGGYASTALTALTYGFMANTAMAMCDTVALKLPAFTGTNGAVTVTTTAPVTNTFTGALSDQGDADATITFKLAGDYYGTTSILAAGSSGLQTLPATTACSLTVGTGLSIGATVATSGLTALATFYDTSAATATAAPTSAKAPTSSSAIASSAAITGITASSDTISLTVQVGISTSAWTRCAVYASGATAPTSAQVIAGTGTAICAWVSSSTGTGAAVGATNGPVVAVHASTWTLSTGRTITYTGLTAATTYDVYCASSSLLSAVASQTTASTTSGSYKITSTVSLAGIASSQFTAAAQSWFKAKVAAAVATCGTDAATQCAANDVTIGSYSRRRDLAVTFSVALQSSAAATSAATTLNTYMTGGTFVTDLQACTYSSCSLTSITGVTVTSAAVATATSSSSTSSSSSTTTSVSGAVSAATLSMGGLVAVLFALLRLQ